MVRLERFKCLKYKILLLNTYFSVYNDNFRLYLLGYRN